MAFPTMTQAEKDTIDNANRRALLETQHGPMDLPGIVIQKTREKSLSLLEGLTHLVVCFWYFFFTGLCILFKRDMPKEWLYFLKNYEKGKLVRNSHKKKRVSEQVEIPKKKFRVVDIETHKPLSLPTS